MIRNILVLFILIQIFPSELFAQKDNYYLEDQIFITATYNMIVAADDSILQGGFSNGMQIGYIRDIPLNDQRNIGLGLGIAYSISHIYQNISIKTLDNGATEIKRMNSDEYIRNKFAVSYLDIPLEFRYRTSTIDKHKFFRAYLGIKAGYRLRAYSKTSTKITEIAYYNQPEFNWWRYSTYLNIGYSTWNIHVSYSLSKVFKDGTMTTPKNSSSSAIPMDMNELTVGLTFYLI